MKVRCRTQIHSQQNIIMHKPKISILINNYNYSAYLPEAIDSALNQTYSNTEVIVVDDESTDNSREIINSYGDKILSFFKKNGGQASAINEGFRHASGDIVMFLDADDALLPHIAEEVAHCFENNSQLVKVQFRLQVVDADGQPTGGLLPPARLKQPSGDLKHQLMHTRSYAHPPTSGNAFLKSICDHIMPIPEAVYRKGAPSYLMYTVGIFGNIHSIDTIGGLYRMHTDNVTAKNPFLDGSILAAHLEEEICHRKKQIELFQKHLGIKISDIGRADFTNIKARIILKKLYFDKYIYHHSLLELMLRGVLSTFLHPNIKTWDRPVWAIWFLIFPLLPHSIAYRLTEKATGHKSRGRYIKLLIGNRDRRY